MDFLQWPFVIYNFWSTYTVDKLIDWYYLLFQESLHREKAEKGKKIILKYADVRDHGKIGWKVRWSKLKTDCINDLDTACITRKIGSEKANFNTTLRLGLNTKEYKKWKSSNNIGYMVVNSI